MPSLGNNLSNYSDNKRGKDFFFLPSFQTYETGFNLLRIT